MKYNGSILVENLICILSKDRQLTHQDFKVFFCWFKDSLDFKVSMTSLAETSGVSINNLHRSLKRLSSQKWIKLEDKQQTKMTNGRWSVKNNILPGEKLISIVEAFYSVKDSNITEKTVHQNDKSTVHQNDGLTLVLANHKKTVHQNDKRSVLEDALDSSIFNNSSSKKDLFDNSKGANASLPKKGTPEYEAEIKKLRSEFRNYKLFDDLNKKNS